MTEPPRRQRDKRPGVTPEAVADAALALINERGVAALTMRALANELGVYPTTVYWHVGNKAQLIALAFQRVFDDIDLADPAELPWQDWISSMAWAARERLGQHPQLTAYFTSQIQVSASSLQLSEKLLVSLTTAGFAGEQLVMAYNAVIGTVFGWISGEYATAPEEADDQWGEYFQQKLAAAGTESLPVLGANLDRLANRAFMLRWHSGNQQPMRTSFEFMLQVLIDGLAAQPQK